MMTLIDMSILLLLKCLHIHAATGAGRERGIGIQAR